MKKMKPTVKAVLVPTLVLTSTAAITYAVPGVVNKTMTETMQDSLKLEVKRVDGDTVKVSLGNVQDIPKSLQFSVKLEGVTPKNGESSIVDLIAKSMKELADSGDTNFKDAGVLTDFTYNESENTIDVLVTSNKALPKIGNSIDVFELEVEAIAEDSREDYQILPYVESEYKYVSATNEEYADLGVTHDNQKIPFALAPKITSSELAMTVADGHQLTKEQIIAGLGIQFSHEDGTDGIELEMTRDNEVITEFCEKTVGIYELQLRAVKGEKKSEPLSHEDGTDGIELEMTRDNEVITEFCEKTVGIYELQLRAVKGEKKSEPLHAQINVVLDNVKTPPQITRDGKELTDMTLDGGSKFVPLENVKAEDAKGRPVSVSVKVDKDLDLDPEQDTEYTFTYTATDIYGNTAEKSMKLRVVANQAPVISGVEDITINQGDKFNPKKGVTVTDDKDKDLKLVIEGTVNTAIPGTYKVSYSVTDSGGKTTRAQRNVTVQKTTTAINNIPIIIAKDIVIKEGEDFNPLEGVIAYDREDKDLTKSVKVLINEVDRFKPGTYKLVYQVTDSQGAIAKKEIQVTVLPKMTSLNSIPVITATDKTITVGDEFNPLDDVSAEDEEDGDLTESIKIVDNEVNIYRVGKYYVTYEVTDSQGAKCTKTIAVTVNPRPAIINSIPVIDAVDQTLKLGEEFNPLQHVRAYDKEDLDLTHKVEVIENNVDTTKTGDYIVTYRVTDSGGATATKTINVKVLMPLIEINIAPEIRATDLVLKVGDTFNPKENVVAYDVEDLDITHKLEVIENNVDTKVEGVYEVKYRVTDSGGATTTKTITVTVKASDSIVLATEISIQNKDDNKVYVNGHKNFIAQVNENADVKSIDWEISDPSIAELRIVRNEARIIAKKPGEVTLTAKTTDGSNLTDSIQVLVTNFEDETEVPNYIKEMIDSTILTPLSGVGDEQRPLEVSVNDITPEKFDEFLNQLENNYYKLIDINKDEEFTTYQMKIQKKVGLFNLFKSKEATYIKIKVANDLTSSKEINEKLSQLVDSGTQIPDVNTPPVISVEGVKTQITVGDSFDPLEGVVAWDKEDGDLTNQLHVEGNVDTLNPGDYLLTYKVTDAKGSTVEMSVTITVLEKQPGTGEENKPGTGEENKPGTGEENKPGTGEENKPGTGEENKPGTGEENKPGTGEENKPETGIKIVLPVMIGGVIATISGIIGISRGHKKTK